MFIDYYDKLMSNQYEEYDEVQVASQIFEKT